MTCTHGPDGCKCGNSNASLSTNLQTTLDLENKVNQNKSKNFKREMWLDIIKMSTSGAFAVGMSYQSIDFIANIKEQYTSITIPTKEENARYEHDLQRGHNGIYFAVAVGVVSALYGVYKINCYFNRIHSSLKNINSTVSETNKILSEFNP